MNNLWCSYIKERLGHDSLYNDMGFITYTFGDDSLFIRDAYILPQYRKNGEMQLFFNRLETLAKEMNLSKIVTSISPNENLCRSNRGVLAFLLKNNFEMIKATNLNVFFMKELNNG